MQAEEEFDNGNVCMGTSEGNLGEDAEGGWYGDGADG
jgi:hypothetical protein